MFKDNKEILGVTLNEDALRIVRLKQSAAGSKVVAVIRKDTRDVSEEDLPRIVSAAVGEIKAKNIKAICMIPSNFVTTKNIEIPSLDPKEIESIIELQSGRHTPYAREEIIVGYITIGTFQRNYTKVLLVIVNRDVVKKKLNALERGGLSVEKVLFAPECAAHFYASVMNVKKEDTPVGIIDIGNQMTDFIIEYNTTVATCRSIPIGINQLIKNKEASTDKLIEEIIVSKESYENEDISRLPEIYLLTTDDPTVKDLQSQLQERLKVNIKIMPYLDHVQAEQPIMLKFVSEYNDDSFLKEVAVSIALDHALMDLTPDEIKMQRSIEEKGRQIAMMGVLSLILIFLLIGIFYSKLYFRNIYVQKIKKEYDDKRQKAESLQHVAQKTQIIKDYLRTRQLSLDIVREIYLLIPDDIYIENIFLDEKGKISIQGIAESLSSVFNFATSLKNSDLFKSADTKSTTDKKDRGKNVTAFELEIRHVNSEEEKEVEEEIEELATNEEK